MSYASAFKTELDKLIELERQRVLEELEFGGAVNDYADYYARKSYLLALKAVRDMFPIVEKTLEDR